VAIDCIIIQFKMLASKLASIFFIYNYVKYIARCYYLYKEIISPLFCQIFLLTFWSVFLVLTFLFFGKFLVFGCYAIIALVSAVEILDMVLCLFHITWSITSILGDAWIW